MNLGYACLAVGVANTQIKSCILANATESRIAELIEQNLDAVARMLDYNGKMGIHLFRMSSDIIPFAGNPVNTLDWSTQFTPQLAALGDKARNYGIRLSMHPGQYSVLNSPRKDVVEATIRDLEYHTTFMDAMGLGSENKIILHVGGGYGNHREAMERFALHAEDLSPQIKSRLVLENDERIFNIEEVLELSEVVRVPVVFDILHHQANPSAPSGAPESWITAASKTWGPLDGPPKLHYSQQDKGKKTGAHSVTISLDDFIDFIDMVKPYHPDIMLEVKDKNLSAVKCMNALAGDKKISRLEQEWALYKYNVLEHAPNGYNQIRQLLKEKDEYPVRDFYGKIEEALGTPVTAGNARNAAEHVWGYFKSQAEPTEKARFERLLSGFGTGTNAGSSMKTFLLKLQEKYQDEYLKQSLYFYLP
jgi:UV DNA damage endonuclease